MNLIGMIAYSNILEFQRCDIDIIHKCSCASFFVTLILKVFALLRL
jgi:hypothetical protein